MGVSYPLLGPFDAIDDEERDKALIALLAVAAAVGDHPAVGRFIDAVCLVIEGERPTVH